MEDRYPGEEKILNQLDILRWQARPNMLRIEWREQSVQLMCAECRHQIWIKLAQDSLSWSLSRAGQYKL